MQTKIYADNAATTKPDIEAIKAMLPYLEYEYGNASSLYALARKPKKILKDIRKKIASAINAKPEEIYFTSGGTESDNWAIKGTAFALRNQGNHIITSSVEHHAVLHSCSFLEKLGFDITYLPVDSRCEVSCKDLRAALRSDTILVSLILANNEVGTIQNIKDLAFVSRENGITFHTDAVQAVGHIPVDIGALGVDMLSASAHKFYGIKGVGFLYISSKRNDIIPYMSGGAQENGYRAGTENIAGIVSMGVALENNVQLIEEQKRKLTELEWIIISKLTYSKIDFIRNGSENRLPGSMSLSFAGIEGERLLHRLDLMGIAVSTGSACNSKSTEVSHVIKAMSVDSKYAYGTIRISFGKHNTIKDAEEIASAIVSICAKNKDIY